MSKALINVSLKHGLDDESVAVKLRELLRDADDGFRRVVKAGLYIEWIAANLGHGQLLPWLEAHCPDVSQRTIYNWRSLAKNLCEWAGLKFATIANLPVSGDRLLDCPASELPEPVADAREKMKAALGDVKNPKQLFLFLGFKQGEIAPNGYPRAKIGRAKGEGGASREQRQAAQQSRETTRLKTVALMAEETAIWLEEHCDANGVGLIEDRVTERLAEAVEFAHGFLQALIRARRGR